MSRVEHDDGLKREKPEVFRKSVRKDLERQGLYLIPPFRESLLTMRNEGRFFDRIMHEENSLFMNLLSRNSEIAFNPDPRHAFIRESSNKTLDEQLAMVDEYSNEIRRKTGSGVEAVIGNVADYAGLAFTYFEDTGYHLFGYEYPYISRPHATSSARTVTPTVDGKSASVGPFFPTLGLNIFDDSIHKGTKNVVAYPLIVPAR